MPYSYRRDTNTRMYYSMWGFVGLRSQTVVALVPHSYRGEVTSIEPLT